MAEITPAIEVENFFSMGSEFNMERAETAEAKQFTTRFAANGDYACSAEYDLRKDYTNEWNYCSGSPNIASDLGGLASSFGSVVNEKLPTKLEIVFEAGVGATGTIEGHQHDSNPHASGLTNYSLSGVIPASSGVGVPTLITVAGDVSPVRATITFEIEHVDKPGADGGHFAGQNIRCHCTANIEYEGLVTGVTEGDWLNVLVTTNEENSTTPTSTVSCEQWIDA
jgi:hypothetical protein